MKKRVFYRGVAAAAAVSLGLSFGSGVDPAHAARTTSGRYTGPGFVVVATIGTTGPGVACYEDDDSPGLFCTVPLPGETHVDIRVDDDHTDPVPARYAFQLGDSRTIEGRFCGSVANVPIPSGTRSLWVHPVAQVGGGPCPTDAVATTGTITVDLS